MTTIVLLPGMDGSGALFSEFIDSLPAGLEPVVVAYPPDKALGYEELQKLVAEKLPREPFILVGESFSGPIAIAVAASAPAGLRGLILVGSFARAPVPAPTFLAHFPIWGLPVRLAALVLPGAWNSEKWRARLGSVMKKVAPMTWQARLRAVLSVDVVSHLGAIPVPMLYLRGRSDRLVPASAWKLIEEALPSARLIELEGPHLLLQANPVESAARVARFAKELKLVP